VKPTERADMLFAQLDLLLAQGRLDAAREVASRLSHEFRTPGTPPPSGHRKERKDLVLEPLTTLLRSQRVVERDLRRFARVHGARVEPWATAPTELARELEERGDALPPAFAEWTAGLSERAGEAASAEAEASISRLRSALADERYESARDALSELRRMLVRYDDGGPTLEMFSLADAGGGSTDGPAPLLEELEAKLGLSGLDDSLADVEARQQQLLDSVVPQFLDPIGTQPSLSVLKAGLQQARDSMISVVATLRQRHLGTATEHATAASETLDRAVRWVDEAWGGAPIAAGGPSFLASFVQRRMPEWEFPPALAVRLHEAIARCRPDSADRRELMTVVRQLSAGAGCEVHLHRRRPDDPGTRRIVDTRLAPPGSGRRYVVRLAFSQDPGSGLAPAATLLSGGLRTVGGGAVRLLEEEGADSSLAVFRLEDHGGGPPLDYDRPMHPAGLRDALERRLSGELVAVEQLVSPVRGEALAWLDSLLLDPEGSPLPEEDLRLLGIPWYDVADFVDRLRPVVEQLQFQLLEPTATESFAGLVWRGPEQYVLLTAHLGADGRSPTVMMQRALLAYMTWSAERGPAKEAGIPLTALLTALQIHMSLKLTFFDHLDPGRLETTLQRCARVLERHYLNRLGLDGSALRDLLARVLLRHEESSGETPLGQHAANLFDARAGEELMRSHKLPASAIFGPGRTLLASHLRSRGHLETAQSVEALDAFRDIAILFGNLIITPDGSGVLLIGDSKIGKSSITARLVSGQPRKGIRPWTFGASDRVLLLVPDPHAPPERIGHVDGPLAGASPAHRSFGQWTQELWYRDADGREVKPADHAVFRGLVPLRSIVLVRREGGERRGVGLAPTTVAELVRDFQHRFDFPASRRFWHDLFGAVSLHEITLKRRGADTFHDAAASIRTHVGRFEHLRGMGRRDHPVREADGAWFLLEDHGAHLKVTRVAADGVDVAYKLLPSGEVRARPQHLGSEVSLRSGGKFGFDDLARLFPLEPGRLQTDDGLPRYRSGPNRSMPLAPEYFRSTMAGPCLLVPALPPAVVGAVLELMDRDPRRWFRWLDAAPPNP